MVQVPPVANTNIRIHPTKHVEKHKLTYFYLLTTLLRNFGEPLRLLPIPRIFTPKTNK